MRYTTVLFDIDGTLLDPGPSLTESARYALAKMGIIENDPVALHRFVGPPLEHSFRDYYGFSTSQVSSAVEHFREYLVDKGLHKYTAYLGMPELLVELSEADAALAVVTSKIDFIARRVLEDADFTKHFRVICGIESNTEPVEKQTTLGEALRQLNLTDADKSSIVMIGDRRHDIVAAKVNGVDSIGILHGYGTEQELLEAGATHIAQDASALRSLLLA